MNSIRFYREANRMTQAILADKCDVSVDTILRWEKGTREPRASDIRRLCEALKVSEADLLYGPKEGEIEITVKFYEEDFWEVSDMKLATNTPGAFAVAFGPSTIGIQTCGNWKNEEDVHMAFEIARTRAIEVFRLQKDWVNEDVSVPQLEDREFDGENRQLYVPRAHRSHQNSSNDFGR